MKKNIFFIAGLLFSISAFGQGKPGGVRDSIKVWLKANAGIIPGAGNTVPQWNELSGANLTGNFAPSTINSVPQLPATYVPNAINFNPHVSFDKTKPNGFVCANEMTGNSLFDPVNNTVFLVMYHPYIPSYTGVYLKWQNANNAPRFGFEINNNGTAGQDQRYRFDFNGTLYGSTAITNRYILSDVYTNPTQKGIYINGALDMTGAAAGPVTTSCVGKIGLANEPPVGSVICPPQTTQPLDAYPTTVNFAEIVWYKRALTALERNKVESYLAVKYGFTLDQSATYANNYTASNNRIIWNSVANRPFSNNITGIGRDDSSGLVQRQSKSINNPTGMVTIYRGAYNGSTLPVANTDNTNQFAADTSFVLYGDNNLGLTFTRCFAGVSASTSSLRLTRVWKAQTTGSVSTVTLAIPTATLPATTRNLLVSTDSAFTAANTTIYPLNNSNGILTASVTLPAGNSYFTYAGDSLTAKPTSNSPVCQGSDIRLFSNATGGTFSWTGPVGFLSTSATPVIPNAQVINSGYYVLNGTISGCPVRPDSVKVVVSVKPPPPTVTTPLIYCAGDVAQPLTAGFIPGNILRWYSQPVGGSGTTTPPIPDTRYEDTLTYWVVQDNQGCESIRSKQQIQIRYKPNGIILGTQASICQGSVDTFYYYGNPRGNAIFDFKTPAFYTTKLSGSDAGPYIVRFDSAGKFRIRMQVNNFGCVGDETFFDVTVRPSPAAYATSKEDVCVEDVVNIALYNTATNVTRYDYDFDNGEMIYGTATGGPYGIKWHTAGLKVVQLIATTVGCPSRITYDSINVHDLPDGRIAYTSSQKICAGDSVLFRAGETDSNTHFIWTPDYYFTSGNVYEAYGVVKKPGYVHLTTTSQYGCVAMDSVAIDAQPCCQVYFPNAFTPNGDGNNDVFRVITKGHHEIATFRVLNRWGQVVYESKDERAGWNGTYNGKEQDAGAYFYYIKYMCQGNEVLEQKGEFLLLR